ncbi:hypothetical protein FZZ93_16520 [Halomonas eurihalina]|uniref:Nucleotide modification associated domain-containing protein n=1 Tax=Halomonas eurihalina TaxID=42566 RepID=A0A5D9CKR4_HALER|nr:hypothetical protein [Halomonas eurihalina]MDR5860314.1 hypothetical protein [Halomonas eurihalina]TZG32026.1 hypothetical protein FZZ93_16520 [Halomonas eurihalina]
MKLILSRKGFDSAAGGVPSPILPDGRLVVLPIPDARSTISYAAISHAGEPLGSLVSDLTRGRIAADTRAHLDPDLTRESLPRQPGWRPVFGQMGQALGHLRNQGVGPGDLFLFFGLFRRVERVAQRWRWVSDAAPCHVLWGWMQVSDVLSLGEGLPSAYSWAGYHPHCQRLGEAGNALYIARRRLQLTEGEGNLPGAGIFSHYAVERRLTAENAARVSDWELPGWWYPDDGRSPLSYHGDPKRWRRSGGKTALRAVARGQEFVLDTGQYPEALPWVRELVQN